MFPVIMVSIAIVYIVAIISHWWWKKLSHTKKKHEDKERYSSLATVGIDRLQIDNGELDCMVEIRTVSGSKYLVEEADYLKSIESTEIKANNKWVQKDAIEYIAYHYIGTGTIYSKDLPMGVRVGILGNSKTEVKMVATRELYDGGFWEDTVLIWSNGSWRWGNDWEVPSLVWNLNYNKGRDVDE